MTQDSRLTAQLLVVAAAVLFSTGGAMVKAISLSSWQIACCRSGIAFLAILVMLPAARRAWSWRTVVVGCAYAGALVSYVLANKLTTAANVIFLFSTAPLYILFLGPWLLKEPVRRRHLLLMAALAVGLALVLLDVETALETAVDPLRGNLLAALGGVFWALLVVGLRWMGREGAGSRGGSSAAAVAVGNLIAFLFCLPPALPLELGGSTDWLLLVYLGVVQIGVAYVCLLRGLRRVGALEASLLILVEPVLNPIWAFWLHGEAPGRWALTGGVVIVAALVAKAMVSGAVGSRDRPDSRDRDDAADRESPFS